MSIVMADGAAENVASNLSSEVYDVFGLCTADELAPIVEVLVNSPASALAITRAFEQHHPAHDRYADQIANEFYRLGNEALGIKDHTRASIAVLLTALCKQIGVPADPSSPARNAGQLTNLFAKQHLSTARGEARQVILNEACLAAGATSAGFFSSDAWPPLTTVLLHVTDLRDRHRHLLPAQAGFDDSVPPEGAMIVDGGGDPLFALTTVPFADADSWQSLSTSSRLSGAFSPLLKIVEPFVSAREMLGDGNVYRAILPPGQSLSFSEKIGAYVGSAGNVKGQVPFEKITLTSLAGPAAIPILISAYLEQKRLDELEKSLTDIKKAIEAVAAFQKAERRSVLRGSTKYFQQVAGSVLAGEIAGEVAGALEQHEVKLVQVQEHLEFELAEQIAALRAVEKGGWGSSAKYEKALEERQHTLDLLFDEALLCVRARACGYQLLCAFEGREQGKRQRSNDIAQAALAFSPGGEIATLMDRLVREKAASLPLTGRATVLARENRTLEKTAAGAQSIVRALTAARADTPASEELVAIDFRIENGQVTQLRFPNAPIFNSELASATETARLLPA